jgi:hypothetical protein
VDKKIISCILTTVVIVSGCNSGKQAAMPDTLSNVSVVTSHSPTAQFPAGSKYAFVKYASESDQDTEAGLIIQRIQTELNNELKKKGYKPGEYSDVRFFVSYTLGVKQEIVILAGKSKSQGNEWISAVLVPNDYVSGALLVQIIDAKTMEPVWVGVFNADVQLASVDEGAKRERVRYAVRELLKTFPAKN